MDSPRPFPILTRSTTCFFLSLLLLLLLTSLPLLNVFNPSWAKSALLLRSSPPPPPRPAATQRCDYTYGKWVWDEAAEARSYTEDCAFLDPGFRCRRNGRPDLEYRRWRWQPDGCDLPRFNGSRMLEMTRNKTIVFAGDSIGRNQWESLLCMLAREVENQSSVYEKHGRPMSKHKGYLSVVFHDHNLTVEYYRLPFLVVVGRPPPRASPGGARKAIHVDRLHWVSRRWVGADILVFNGGHWWSQDKTAKKGFFFQQGKELNATMGVGEAFGRMLRTWREWVLRNLDPRKSHVFFRSYAPTHFRGGEWNAGGVCNPFRLPETNTTELRHEPLSNRLIAETIDEIRRVSGVQAEFLNVTYLTELRKDGHPSRHRELGTPEHSPEDCSHWCLPGVPDTWNELLYVHLLWKESAVV